jgi:hypothetical protein
MLGKLDGQMCSTQWEDEKRLWSLVGNLKAKDNLSDV